MKQQKFVYPLFVVIFLGILLSGCGKEITRESIQSVGQYEFEFSHEGGPVSLWTDLDIEYIEATEIWYQVRFYQNGNLIDELTCDPFDHQYRLMSRQTVVRGVSKQSFLAPMLCEVELPAGKIDVAVDLYAKGGRVRIFRADLVIHEKE